MKGKLLTIAGIIFVFGYFISESLKNDSSDPTQVVIVGNDTLGRDWGAMAEQKAKEVAELNSISSESGEGIKSISSEDNSKVSLNTQEDPFSRQKLKSSDYSSIQDASGREVITGYNRPEEQDNANPYQTRHQKEKGNNNNDVVEEPTIIYRE